MKKLRRLGLVALVCTCSLGAAILSAFNSLADVPSPVLVIQPLGSNQFAITITNGVATTNYTLLWTPVLGDSNWTWEVLGPPGAVGETNFYVDAGDWGSGFFKTMVGDDSDGDGIPDWKDAAPHDRTIGILSVTIDSPLNGAVLN